MSNSQCAISIVVILCVCFLTSVFLRKAGIDPFSIDYLALSFKKSDGTKPVTEDAVVLFINQIALSDILGLTAISVMTGGLTSSPFPPMFLAVGTVYLLIQDLSKGKPCFKWVVGFIVFGLFYCLLVSLFPWTELGHLANASVVGDPYAYAVFMTNLLSVMIISLGYWLRTGMY